MEGTFEGGTLAGRLGGIAVPTQVAVPLAVLVGKVLLAIIQNLVEDIQVSFVLGVAVDHHGGDDNFKRTNEVAQ